MRTSLIICIALMLTSFALATQQGSITGWGSNVDFDDSMIYYGQATPPDCNDYFTSVDGGYHHSVALKSDGTLLAWGADYYDQVSTTPTGGDFIAVAAGDDHNVAIRSDFSLESWGDDYYDQVFDTPGGNNFIAVSAGYVHSLALTSDGYLVAWGVDDDPTERVMIKVR